MAKFVLLFIGFFVYCMIGSYAVEVNNDESSTESIQRKGNDSNEDLYVVRAMVYEVGILTEVDDNETLPDLDDQERVDLTFYDTHSNDSHIDLGTIPLPVETNVSGQVFTGFVPVHVGAFSNPSEVLETLPITGAIANITQSDTGVFQLQTSENGTVDQPVNITGSDLHKIGQKITPDTN